VRDVLCLGSTHGPTLQVPATTPRVVVVEAGGQRIVATIEPDGASHVAVGAGDVVLGNLRGERWAARSVPTTRQLSDRDAPENGIWVLIDGTDHYELPPHQLAIAQALGHRLARRGYSLVTFGLAGVSHVVARGFSEVLADQGYTSGIYRLAHVVPHGERPDFADWGRTVFRDSQAEGAVRLADLVLAIGRSDLTEAVASIGAIPIAHLDGNGDGPDDTGLVPPRPAVWDAVAADDFVTATLDWIGDRFAVADADPPAALRRLTHLAATAFDARDRAEHDERLNQLRAEAPLQISPEDLPWLLADARRPAHRMLGYASGHVIPGGLMLDALRLEQAVIRQLSELRTLWPALNRVLAADRDSAEPIARALAARCYSILSDLGTDPSLDPERRDRTRLRELISRLRHDERASQLTTRAVEYDDLRARQPAGDDRTLGMTKIVDEIAERFAQAPALPEADVWFGHGTPGTAIVGLALLLGTPDPGATPILEHAISHPLSPFEQFTALRVLHQSLDVLFLSDLRRLRGAIEDQRGAKGSIDPLDESRWLLSESLLRQIDHRLDDTKPSVILFLALDPSPAGRLALDATVRDIEHAMRGAPQRDALNLTIRGAVQVRDVVEALAEERPVIVHLSSRAASTARSSGPTTDAPSGLAPPEMVQLLFSQRNPSVRIVVLDACFDDEQARALTEVVDCVIGLRDSMPDLTARAFLTAFYRGLAHGGSVQNAFDQGFAAVALEAPDGRDRPELALRRGVNAEDLYVLPHIIPPLPPRGAETA